MTDRVMPGMVLGYRPTGVTYEQILVVASVRRARSWTTAKLRSFGGSEEVYALVDYSVRFPDHVIGDGDFRVLTSRDLVPRDVDVVAVEHVRKVLEHAESITHMSAYNDRMKVDAVRSLLLTALNDDPALAPTGVQR